MMKPIVTDTYDFPTLIRRGYVYVDKTAYLHRLVSGVDGLFFFMSRPRRFGKSLMISTLEQIFKGEKSLFKGLVISRTDYDWTRHPIIRLDMTAFDHTSGLSAFKRALAHELGGTEPIAAFRAMIEKKAKASHGNGVVVLVDEYDSPVSGLLGKPAELEAMRDFLQSFYRILKQEVASIRFVMMTGVSKFTKLSVFSGLNNLTDLTMDPTYAGLLGYTREELSQFLSPQIDAFARESKRPPSEIVAELLAWYDSYRFSPKSEICVCNPVSVGLALKSKSFEAFWNRTGSSTLIIEHLRKCGKLPIDIENLKLPAKRLDVCDLRKLPIEALMYQGGYLTIKSVASDGDLMLGFPNRETREAVYGGFLDEILKGRSDDFWSLARELGALLSSDPIDGEALQNVLVSAFAMVPHEWRLRNEAEAKRYFLLFMKLAGADIIPESESSQGRADAVLLAGSTTGIFEFKYDKTTRAALKQIVEKRYYRPYVASARTIIGIGVNYDSDQSEISVATRVLTGAENGKGGPVKPKGGLVKSKCGPVNSKGGPVKLLKAIRDNPGLRTIELAKCTGITERSIKRYLSRLKDKVIFRGAPKTGGYYAIFAEGGQTA